MNGIWKNDRVRRVLTFVPFAKPLCVPSWLKQLLDYSLDAYSSIAFYHEGTRSTATKVREDQKLPSAVCRPKKHGFGKLFFSQGLFLFLI
jgi:hypothetical protein